MAYLEPMGKIQYWVKCGIGSLCEILTIERKNAKLHTAPKFHLQGQRAGRKWPSGPICSVKKYLALKS